MFFIEFLFVLIITLILTAVFATGFRRHTTWNILVPFFVILFLATWATGIWITPIGPMVGGVFWFPFVWVGVIYALLLTAFIPPRDRRSSASRHEKARQAEKERRTFMVLDAFFWVLILGLLIAILSRYLVVL
ncbi:hypothetical protein GF339_16860 [candidate division KSB3 bacterium]|uniref:Uncharacterized protein n=1 Tax=candidate division KSB3 bacterium TaxID=2044937 RepID=A0A9D5JXR7_9BACT|nr:hypothetical protein [candidate division KSB3 bacterium]MBD3326259.1 hypothetical protein [candidate division KSB3 bacterium]